jgi:hypothetical protein
MDKNFKFETGQRVRIIEGIFAGNSFSIEEDGKRMSEGPVVMPSYYYLGHWIYECNLVLSEVE